MGVIQDFEYTGTVQDIKLQPGTYVFECWGAQGGSVIDSPGYETAGSSGGYSIGTLNLQSETTFYIYVGGKGEDCDASQKSNDRINGGWNGGGSGIVGYDFYSLATYYPRSGGGATDISLSYSTCEYVDYRTVRSTESLDDRIMVAGGGAGALSYILGNQITKSSGTSQGGGETGCGHSPGTQTAAGTGASGAYGCNTNVGGNYFHGGGGGGYWGGGCTFSGATFSAGGSGFVKKDNSGIFFTDASAIAGDEEISSPDGTAEIGHFGNGHVRITRYEKAEPSVRFSINKVFELYNSNRFFLILLACSL